MSFILSALKKVENKRSLGSVPELSAIQVQSYEHSDNRHRTSIVLATVGIAAVVIFTALWLYKPAFEQNPTAPIATDTARLPVNTQPTIATPSQSPPPYVVDNNPSPAAQTSYPPQSQPTINNATASPQLNQNYIEAPGWEPLPVGIVNYDELPKGLRQHIPNIQLSAHIHSDLRPRARKVIINGVALREGQRLSDDLTVHQINADGVVMDFQGTLFLLGKDSIFN